MNETLTSAASEVPTLQRRADRGIDLTKVALGSHREVHVTLRTLPREAPQDIIRRLTATLSEHNAVVVHQQVFGSIAAYAETIRSMRKQFSDFDWPLMWVDGGGTCGGIAGMHVFAVTGTNVQTIHAEGRPVGRIFHDGPVRHCFLADVKSLSPVLSHEIQCRQTFEQLEGALDQADMTIKNVVRTWFYLDDILSWYRSFNSVRNDCYRKKGILDGFLPASTGIGARNPSGAALVADAWAIHDPTGSACVRAVPSPMQFSSIRYGSAFSRAVLLQRATCRHILVSGTASVDRTGQSAHPGNLKNQIALTMEVVEALLHSQGFNLSNVTGGSAYFKDIDGIETFDVYLGQRDLTFLPLVRAQAHICRDELLFEIELDALSTANSP